MVTARDNLFGNEIITVKGSTFSIEVVPARGRSSSATITDGRVRIRLPPRMLPWEMSKEAMRLKAWAIGRLERMDLTELRPSPRFVEFFDGQVVEAMGRRFRITANDGTSRSSSASLDGDEITVRLETGMAGSQRAKSLSSSVRRVISKELLPSVQERVARINSSSFGFQYNSVGIRGQMSRWGSCSTRRRSISLSFRLLFAPQDVLDYVIVHELAHLRHPNHSRAFWRCVESAMPDYKARRLWLREGGRRLGISPENGPVPSGRR